MSEQGQIVIERPAPPALVAEVAPIVQAARAFEVVDVVADAEAQERAKRLRHAERTIAEHFEPTRKHLDAAKKEWLAFRDGLVGPIAEARGIYDSKSIEYQAAERRKAEELERILRERARKEEEERQILAAIEAEEVGESAEAEAILAQPIDAPAVTVAPTVAQVKGVSSRIVWSPEIDDVRKVLRFMLERDEWLPTLEKLEPILETALRPLATAQQRALSIPGVRAVLSEVRSYRG